MGNGLSMESDMALAARKGDVAEVFLLRRQGALLEVKDHKGRSPLYVACSHARGYEAAAALLALGADVQTYRPGAEGGFPIHEAARMGLNRSVGLLLHHGADPLALNDAGQTSLALARAGGHASTVHFLEERIALFRGFMRQQMVSKIGSLLAPLSVSRKVWVVVLPILGASGLQSSPQTELLIYSSKKSCVPLALMPLGAAHLSLVRAEGGCLALLIEDLLTLVRVKLSAEEGGAFIARQRHVQQLLCACRGRPQGTESSIPHSLSQAARRSSQGPPLPSPPPPLPPSWAPFPSPGSIQSSNARALHLAIRDSIRTAEAEAGVRRSRSCEGSAWGQRERRGGRVHPILDNADSPEEESEGGEEQAVAVAGPSSRSDREGEEEDEEEAATDIPRSLSRPLAWNPHTTSRDPTASSGQTLLSSLPAAAASSSSIPLLTDQEGSSVDDQMARQPPQSEEGSSSSSSMSRSFSRGLSGGCSSSSSSSSSSRSLLAPSPASAPGLRLPTTDLPPPILSSSLPIADFQLPVALASEYPESTLGLSSALPFDSSNDPPICSLPGRESERALPAAPNDAAFPNTRPVNPLFLENPEKAPAASGSGNGKARVSRPVASCPGRSEDAEGERRLCLLCMDAEPEGACIPCGHLACCMRCLKELRSTGCRACPLCRTTIRDVIKVYQI